MGSKEEYIANRDFNHNPPNFAPGQDQPSLSAPMIPGMNIGSVDLSNGGGISPSSMGGFSAGSTQPISQGFDTSSQGISIGATPGMSASAPVQPFGSQAPGLGMQGQQPFDSQQQSGGKEALKQTASQAANEGLSYFANFFQDANIIYTNACGKEIMLMGGGFVAGSLILGILSLVSSFGGGWLSLLVPGVVLFSGGMILMGLTLDKAVALEKGDKQNEEKAPEPMIPVASVAPIPEESLFEDDDEDDSEDEFDDIDDDDDEEWDEDDDEEVATPIVTKTTEEVVESLPDTPKGMFTREYLYEAYMSALPRITPDFSAMKEFEEDDQEFEDWGYKVEESAKQVGLDPSVVELISLYENKMIFKLAVSRQSNAASKEKQLSEELLGMFRINKMGNDVYPNASITYVAHGTTLFFTIVKGTSVMVSIGDIYDSNKEFVKDPNISIPWVLGVGLEGEVHKQDLLDVDSMIVAGPARRGKGWMMLSTLAQMTMWMPPTKLNYYIFDTKGASSSYYRVRLPHVKYFTNDPKQVIEKMKYLATVEGPRRLNEVFSKYGVDKIQSLHEVAPDVDLPYIYIIIDEMVTLMAELDRLGKDAKAEYIRYFRTIATQFPAAGIRFIAVPHRVTDDIIPKTVHTMAKCRICINGTSNDVKLVTDATPSDFPYHLSNKGEMAASFTDLNGGKAFFNQSAVIGRSNTDNNNLFDLIAKVWGKIYPDYKGYWDSPEARKWGIPSSVSSPVGVTNSSDASIATVDDFLGAGLPEASTDNIKTSHVPTHWAQNKSKSTSSQSGDEKGDKPEIDIWDIDKWNE